MQIDHMIKASCDFYRRTLPAVEQAKFTEFRRILHSVLIQDMRTRFGNSHAGYLLAIAWPFSHLAVITLAFLLRTRISPVGDSPTMFIVTGVVPYVLCLYPARVMALSIAQNRQLLNIPIIRPLHLILSRCILETLNAILVLALFLSACYLFDVEIFPIELIEAAMAVGAAVFLGIGLGFFNVVMCALVGQYFLIFFILTMAMLYIFSGVYVPISAMPDNFRSILTFNPLLHLVEWLRSAYFTSYEGDQINKTLIVGVAGVSLALGLMGERFVRGRLLA